MKQSILLMMLALLVGVFSDSLAAKDRQSASVSPTVVKVGGYPFEPFVADGLGITPAFLTLLNGHTTEFRFEFVAIPSQRRYELLQRGVVDAIFFEMPLWGWEEQNLEIDVTAPVLRGQELFVARRDNPQGQGVFALSPDRKIALTLGYHYAFAGYKADQAFIRGKVDAVFGEKISHALRYLQAGSVDLAVMSDIFLYHEFLRNPSLRGQFIVGPKPDHEYALPLMARKNGPVSAKELDGLLSRVRADGSLQAFFSGFGLSDLVIPHKP